MKKLICFFAMLLVFLVGCGNEDESIPREMDFRSMRDTELDVIISLGDSRADVERALGRFNSHINSEGERIGTIFRNGMTVMFEDDAVINITADSEIGGERFEIYGHRANMTPEEISEISEFINMTSDGFSARMGGRAYLFMSAFDEYGNNLNGSPTALRENQAVSTFITWWESPHDRSVQLTVMKHN
jgi:hypothetical protein